MSVEMTWMSELARPRETNPAGSVLEAETARLVATDEVLRFERGR